MTEPEELIDKAARVIANCDGVDRWSGCLENTREDIRDEARALAAAGFLADPEQGSEPEKWKRYYDDAMKVRWEVEKILDKALGTEEEDGAGMGLAGDVALLADQRDRLQASTDKARELLVACDASASWEAMYELVEKARAELPVLPGDETPQPEEDQP